MSKAPKFGKGTNQHAVKARTSTGDDRRRTATHQTRSVEELAAVDELYRHRATEVEEVHHRNLKRFSPKYLDGLSEFRAPDEQTGPFLVVPWEDDTALPYGHESGFFVVNHSPETSDRDPENNYLKALSFHKDREEAWSEAMRLHKETAQ